MWARPAYALALVQLLIASRHGRGGVVAIESAAVPSVVPTNASPVIDRSFPGFAFEEASFYLYATNLDGSPNSFSQAMIQGVLNRTGGTPILRVGGTSGDHAFYNASQQQPAVPDGRTNPPLKTPPYGLSIGPSFFTAFQNFPGCKFMFMVPLATNNITNTLAWTSQGLQNMPAGALDVIEIGNEPNFYPGFTPQSYASQYSSFEQQIVAQNPTLNTTPSFQALDYYGAGAANESPTLAFNAGINSTGGIRQVAYHYYGSSPSNSFTMAQLQSTVVNHTKIRTQMALFAGQLNTFRQISATAPFVLSEDANALSSPGGNPMPTDNILATALWNVDFQLQAMSVGVTRVNMMQIFYPGYSMWQPQDGLVPAGVHANYYSQPMVADFIGPSGNTRVVELRLTGPADPATIAGYAAYDNGQLARIVLINMQLWSKAGGHPRPLLRVKLTGLPLGTLAVMRLTAPQGAFANNSIKYNGQTWQYPSGQPSPLISTPNILTVTSGSLTLPLNATSAVLLSYNSL